jgi:hypothetical protein
MEDEPLQSGMAQPVLFEFAQAASTGAVELFPAVWSAVEALAAEDAGARRNALDRLQQLNAPRLSPLVAYILATRITDPDIEMRGRVIRALGDVLSKDQAGNLAPEAVRKHLANYLAHMRTRPIFALLEVVMNDPGLESSVALLLNACPYAGTHLSSILADRKFAIPLRIQAARFIGIVGFLDAIPVLERLEARLISRLGGQQAMPFAPPPEPDESDLLPIVQSTLTTLRVR